MSEAYKTILGIDPGLASIGLGVIRLYESGRIEHVYHGVIKTNNKKDLANRLAEINADIKEVVAAFKPDEVAIEEFFAPSRKNANGIHTSKAIGVILLIMGQLDIPWYLYSALVVKMHLCNYNKADKIQIQEAVKEKLGLIEKAKPSHAADALAIAICRAENAKALNIVKIED